MSRITDAYAVLTGRKIAMHPDVPWLINTAFAAATRAERSQPETTPPTPRNTMSEPSTEQEQHDTAVTRLTRTRNYLASLPALFVSLAASLAEARAQASVGSAERKAYQDQIDALKAKGDELEELIGGVDSAVAAADAADDALTPPVPPVGLPVEGGTPPTPGDLTAPIPDLPFSPPAAPSDQAPAGTEPATDGAGPG